MITDTGRATPRPKIELPPCDSAVTRRDNAGNSPDVAQTLVDAVHRGDQFTIARILNRPDLRRIAVQLAERLPPRHSPATQWEWLQPCGTRSAAARHVARGEPVDYACRMAQREYDRERKRRWRRAKSAQVEEPSVRTVDPVVVERLIDGQPPLHVTRAERAEAVRILASRDVTVTEISRRLHMSGGRVTQILGAISVASANDTHATEVAS